MPEVTQSAPARQARQPRVKPERLARVHTDADTLECTLSLLVTTANGKTTISTYVAEDVPHEDGRGFALIKPDGETYHLELINGVASCDCKGHVRWGRCKHAAAIVACVKARRL